MKVVFLGTPECGCPYLSALDDIGAEIVAVITQPDRPRGRGRDLCAPPVKLAALERALCVLQPPTCRDEALWEQLRTLDPDVFLVVAYGQILCPNFLLLPRVAALNIHYSLLPQWRGAAPVQRALLAGDTTTGVTLQHLAAELDAGDVVGQVGLEVDPAETSGELMDRLTELGCGLVREYLPLVMAGTAPRMAQDESRVTWAPRLSKADGAVCWETSSLDLVNRVRALNPWPGAYATFRGERLVISRAGVVDCGQVGAKPGMILGVEKNRGPVIATGTGAVELLEVVPRGRKPMDGAAWARGVRPGAGEFLGNGAV